MKIEDVSNSSGYKFRLFGVPIPGPGNRKIPYTEIQMGEIGSVEPFKDSHGNWYQRDRKGTIKRIK